MGRKRVKSLLNVFMNGAQVGQLVCEPSGQLSFTYDHGWLGSEDAVPLSLSLPLAESPYKGVLVENYFDNLLPDSAQIRKRIQVRFNIASNNPFDFLSAIGRDCVGALQFLRSDESPDNGKLIATPLNDEEIGSLLSNYKSAPLGMGKESDFRISLAGAQEKTALLRHQNTWCLPKGSTPTTHIIKLPIGRIEHAGLDFSDSVENEWLCLTILSEFGLPVNHAAVANFAGIKALVVERFDRAWKDESNQWIRLAQEDCCQAMGVSSVLKYQSDGGPSIFDMMNLFLGSSTPLKDRAQFMKTVFLFWVMGAIDGHAKNFSIYLKKQGTYYLTPIYDVLSVYPLVAKKQIQWQGIKMAMSVKGRHSHYHLDKIQARHWLSTAAHCGFPQNEMQLLMDEVCDSLEEVIARVRRRLPPDFPAWLAEAIFDGMRKVRDQCRH